MLMFVSEIGQDLIIYPSSTVLLLMALFYLHPQGGVMTLKSCETPINSWKIFWSLPPTIVGRTSPQAIILMRPYVCPYDCHTETSGFE